MTKTKTPSQWQWQPDWRLWTLTLLFLPVLIGLGFWQLDRAQQKTEERAQWEKTDADTTWPPQEPTAVGQPVVLAGHFDADFQWLLDNRTREGRRGYEVLQLFRPLAGDPVVINRGWIPAPPSREQLPGVVTPEMPLQVEGRLAPWPEPPVLGPGDPEDGQGWPRRVQALNQKLVQAEAGPVSPYLVRLADAEQPGALLVDWAPDRMEAATHRGYALQWFSLAVVLLTLTIAASFSKNTEDSDSQ